MNILADGVAAVLAGKTDAQLARDAYAHLWIAFLLVPDDEAETAIEQFAGKLARKHGIGFEEQAIIRTEAAALLIAYDTMTKAMSKKGV